MPYDSRLRSWECETETFTKPMKSVLSQPRSSSRKPPMFHSHWASRSPFSQGCCLGTQKTLSREQRDEEDSRDFASVSAPCNRIRVDRRQPHTLLHSRLDR